MALELEQLTNLFTNPRAAQNGSTMVEVWRNLRVPTITPGTGRAGPERRAATRWVPTRGADAALLPDSARFRVREVVRLTMPDGSVALGEWFSDGHLH